MRSKTPYLIIIVLLVGISTVIRAQQKDIPLTLESMFARMMNSGSDSARISINDSIRSIVDSYSRSDSVMDHRFGNVRNLGQITSPDRKLKILNWNLPLRNGTNRYFCYIIHKPGKKNAARVFALTGSSRREPIPADRQFTENNWYGALYYAIQPFRNGRTTDYILLGIDYSNLRMTRKLIEVLNFAPDGSLIFGRKCFLDGSVSRYREVFEYSSENVMTLRIHSPKFIAFDHLVSVSGNRNDNPENLGAEYTFDAYILKNGIWTFTRNVNMKNKK